MNIDFYSTQEFALEAVGEKTKYIAYIVINVVLLLITLGIFLLTGNNPFSTLIIGIVLIYGIIHGKKSLDFYEDCITDVKDGYISLENDVIKFKQTAENVSYEEGEVALDEVLEITENNAINKCGFYLFMSEDAKKTKLYVNGALEESRDIIYINGINYNREDFKLFYREVLKNVSNSVSVKGTDTQKNWDIPSEKAKLFQMLLLTWIPFVIVIAHILFALI